MILCVLGMPFRCLYKRFHGNMHASKGPTNIVKRAIALVWIGLRLLGADAEYIEHNKEAESGLF